MPVTVQTLISIFATVTYGGVLLIVSFSKPLTKMRRYFMLYLTAMLVWSVSSFIIFADYGDTTTWFRRLVGSGIVSMIGLFYFVQSLFAKRYRWTPLVFWYGLIALIISLSTPFVLQSAYFESGHLVYEYHPLILLIAGPCYGLTIFSLFELIRGYNQTDSDTQRIRLRYLSIAIGIIILVSLVNWTPLGKYPIDILANGVAAVLISYAILRHSLLDIRVFIRRGLLYSFVTVITGTIYFMLFSLALTIFETFAGGRLLALSIGLAIVSSLVLSPLREKTQEWIDRYFYRTKYDASLMLERLSETTISLMEVEDITDIILDEIMNTLKVEHLSFFVKYETRDVYQLVSYRGSPIESIIEIRIDHPIANWLSDHNQILRTNELTINPFFKSLWDIEKQMISDRKIELFIALSAGNDMVGFFVLGEKLSDQPYTQEDIRILVTAANQTAIAVKNARLFNQLQETFVETVVTLANAIDVRDTYTSDHSQRIAGLAVETAKVMDCLNGDVQDIYWGGLLHDIGKIGIPDAILLKPGPLDDDEWAVIRTHPDVGADLIEPIRQLSHISPIIRYSHERYDGGGYPHGLKDEEIPLGARIVAVVDAFSAMMDKRVYKDANSLDETIEELERNAGTQFDPEVVEAFMKVIEDYNDGNSGNIMYPPSPEDVPTV